MSRRTIILEISICLLIFAGSSRCAATTISNWGSDFWLAITPAPVFGPGPKSFTFYVAAGAGGASGNISVPGLGLTYPFVVPPNSVTPVGVSNGAELGILQPIGPGTSEYELVEDKGIHVISSQPVAVHEFSANAGGSDAYLGLPTNSLGSDYYVMAYQYAYGSHLGVVATVNNTVITITPSINILGHSSGVPYNVTLNQGQTYFLQSLPAPDLSGTRIQSTQPVAVFGGSLGTVIPLASSSAINNVVEQMIPTYLWGKTYYTVPLTTRGLGDTFRIVAAVDGTVVSRNGAVLATLNHGQFWSGILTGNNEVTGSQPIMVLQYSNCASYDVPFSNFYADPSEMQLIPAEDYASSYLVERPTVLPFLFNFIGLVAPSACVGSITMDGISIPPATFSTIGATGYSGATLTASAGPHALDGPCPFGVSLYGFDNYDAYSYPGGLFFVPTPTSTSTISSTFSATDTTTLSKTVTATPSATATATPIAIIPTTTSTLPATPRPTPTPQDCSDARLYPNPVHFDRGEALHIDHVCPGDSFKIYNIVGEFVYKRTLVGNPTEDIWDGLNANGTRVKTGIYFLHWKDQVYRVGVVRD